MRIVHLSDLHIRRELGSQALLFERLVATLAAERSAGPGEPLLLVVSGDVFDSATDPAEALVPSFLDLHRRILAALGGDVPTIVVPGNHDRRRLGVIGPNRPGLFRALANAVDRARVYVAGGTTPFLAHIVPESMHRLPLHLMAYDSSYLPSGLVGAGGTIRPEDLLQAHARLPDDGRPLVVVLHHHLVPTPVTDISRIDAARAPLLARWLVGTALPRLVSNADREELTMTALGAGTALTTLQAFGRAVLLLHGHKHVPTARLLRGMTDTCGDILLTSAGSAGYRERVQASSHPDAARLWPSFNLVDWSGDSVRVQSLSFSPKSNTPPPIRRDLARVRGVGRKWDLEPVTAAATDQRLRLALDEADYAVSPSAGSRRRWDLACERRIELAAGARLRRYIDFVHALPEIARRIRTPQRAFRRVELRIGGSTHFRVADALCGTLVEAARSYGRGTAFEWVGLFCRYGAFRAVLRLARAPFRDLEPFGSATDLSNGRERPLMLRTTDEHWTVAADECPPRTLLRLYWPLPGDPRG